MPDDPSMMPGPSPMGVPAGTPPGPGDHPALMDSMHSQMSQAKGMFDKLKKAERTLAGARKELDKLVALGDTVTQDDIIESTGKLMTHGLTANALAGLLAGMPTNGGGQALAGWVSQLDQGVAQREEMNAHALEGMRYHLATSSLRVLAGHHYGDQAPEGAPPGMPPGARLAPDGNHYVPDPKRPGKYLQVVQDGPRTSGPMGV